MLAFPLDLCHRCLMAYTPDPELTARKLRAVRMAAGAALVNGADVEQVREAVEQGIEEALELLARMGTEHRAA